ncbi:MAG: ribonuclease R [Leptotrichiaceae bacterium]|mgnify:FL=1|jgi:ribonuclease R|nr:ribonuclease R [Leptotrichiaceae bacterium]MBP6167936.1 ribonuclease R [Leptotrichiaceae bacterium]MBP7025689.1 ribonuclease R [Leptotrichiaceae bacterium]
MEEIKNLREIKELTYLKQLLEERELNSKDIMVILNWSSKKRKKNKEILDEWERTGEIYLKKNGKYTLATKMGLIKGDISIANGKFGFLDIPGEKSVFIAGPNLNTAMDGDTVLVKVTKESVNSKSREGEVLQILTRGKSIVIGEYQQNDNFGFVRSRDNYKDIYISRKKKKNAKDGDLVAVKLYFWGDSERKPEGEIISVLGDSEDTSALIKALLINSGITEEFSQEVTEEVGKISENIQAEIANRKDLRDLDIITIDGEDAKDLDDAVYVEKNENGYKLLVSIADVSFYVKEGTELNKEAIKRGNSIYLVDRVIPMLPRKLSNNLCSLNPNEDKLTFTVEMHFDDKGKLIKNDFYRSVIKSKYRMTYTNVNRIIDKEDEVINEYKPIVKMVNEMLELSKILRDAKKRRGSIDFELPETKVVLGEDKKIADIVLRKRGEAERLIEDFMVVTNETVAEKLFWEEIPTIYRVHEDPDKAKMLTLNETLIKFGYSLTNIDEMHPGKFQAIIDKTINLPEGYLIHKLILRAMQRARYSNKNLGHFGLASKYYLHFTSPIRRYSDLIVHRMLAKSIEKFIKDKEKDKYMAAFDVISTSISKTERVADKLEEDSKKIKLVEYMKDKIGEVFVARISGMNKNKIFMELENHVEVVYNVNVEKDDFTYDEENFKITDTKTGESYTMGNAINVFVTNASYDKLDIEVIPYKESREVIENDASTEQKSIS